MQRGLAPLKLMAFAAAIACTALPAGAQNYPSKPIRMVVGFSAGGSTDVIARIVAERLAPVIGQPVTIDNRPGADGIVAAEIVARAAPDGYTLLATPTGHAINNSLYKDVKFDPVADFIPISMIGEAPNMVVAHPSIGVNSLKEFQALAKSKPGQLNYGSTASVIFLAAEMLNQKLGIQTVRVPYKGSAPGIAAILSGEVQWMVSHAAGMVPHANSGAVKGLAVTSAKRTQIAPDLPTVEEAGFPGYVATTWYGVLVPKGTSPEIVTKLNAAMQTVLADEAVKKQLFVQGVEPRATSSEEFGNLIKAEIPKWAQVVKESGATVD